MPRKSVCTPSYESLTGVVTRKSDYYPSRQIVSLESYEYHRLCEVFAIQLDKSLIKHNKFRFNRFQNNRNILWSVGYLNTT